MRTRLLRMRRITWFVCRGSKTIAFLESPTPICLFIMQLRRLYDENNKFICENNARPALKTYEFLHMRQITWYVKDAVNVFLQSFSSTYRIELQKLSIWSQLRPLSATYVLRMRSNGYLCSSGVNLDNIVRFIDPDCQLECKISVILATFLSADTSRDLVTLTFDLLTLNSCHAWRVTWLTLPSSLKTLRPFVHELRVITVPIDYHWKCVPGHCACTESRDLW